MPLRSFAPGLFIADQALTFLGLHLGARMTVVKLPDGGLFVHSPIRLTPPLRIAIDALGPVRHVVAPNLYHHRFIADYRQAYPAANLVGAAGLAKKRADVQFDGVLDESRHPAWEDAIAQVDVQGCMLQETVFFHRATSTLIAADLVENFRGSAHWATGAYLRLGGIYDQPGLSRFLRPLFRDRKAARASIDRVLGWDIRRAVVAHGSPIDDGAHAIVARTYAWLHG